MTFIRRISAFVTAWIFPVMFASPVVHAGPVSSDARPAVQDGRHDFDFWFGRWAVKNRRMLKPLSGLDEWERFDATVECRPILGGMGNEDEFLSPHRPGAIGMSLRFFDPATRQWSIYWIDNKMGVLLPPVVGHFVSGTGVFEGPDTLGGKPIDVRYTWSKTDTPTPQWEQAFSVDGGKTWETNWFMTMSRLPSQPATGKEGAL